MRLSIASQQVSDTYCHALYLQASVKDKNLVLQSYLFWNFSIVTFRFCPCLHGHGVITYFPLQVFPIYTTSKDFRYSMVPSIVKVLTNSIFYYHQTLAFSCRDQPLFIRHILDLLFDINLLSVFSFFISPTSFSNPVLRVALGPCIWLKLVTNIVMGKNI